MDRRGFLSAGIALGGAELLMAQEDPKQQSASTGAKPEEPQTDTCPENPTGNWVNIGKDDNSDEVRAACLRVLRMSNRAYEGLSDKDAVGEHVEEKEHKFETANFYNQLEANFGAPQYRKLDIWAFFTSETHTLQNLVMLMGIRWRAYDEQNKRSKPLLKMIGLNARHIGNSSDACAIKRAEWAAQTMYTKLKLKDVAAEQDIELYIGNDLRYLPILNLVNAAAKYMGANLIANQTLADGSRYWKFTTKP
ncbi:MAG: hypothetical protein AB7O26_05155 [Planctomycetaceae bacterium]